LAIDRNFKDALDGKGESLNGLGNYSQAIPYLDKALAIDPNYTVALNDKGAALYRLGNYSQAVQYFDKALAIDPNYNRQAAVFKMGNVHRRQQVKNEASNNSL